GGIDVRQGARLLSDDRGFDRDLLGIGALLAGLADTEHGIPDPKVLDAFADGADHPGKIAPQDIGKLRLLVVAHAHLPISAVDAASNNIDPHLAGSGGRVGEIAVLQARRPAVSFNESCFHLVLDLRDPQRRVDGSIERSPNSTPSDIHSALRASFRLTLSPAIVPRPAQRCRRRRRRLPTRTHRPTPSPSSVTPSYRL